MNNEFLLSVLTFLLNSILFSGFIIPQAQKLKETKDRLVKFKLTYVPKIGTMPSNIRVLEQNQKQEIVELQNLLDVYNLRSKELKELVVVFRISVGIVLIAILSCVKWPNQKDAILVSHALLQLANLFNAILTYAIRPDRLQEANYLVNELDINPHALVSALDLNPSIEIEGGLFAKIKREDPLKINLMPKVRVWGFRFLFLITNKSEQVYFVSFGPITTKTRTFRHLIPQAASGSAEYNRIEIGSFPFNLVEEKQDLELKFLVFLPFFKQEESHPFIIEGVFEAPGIQSGILIRGSSLGMFPITTTKTYIDIKFRGEGTRINKFYLENKDANILNAVVNKFSKELIKSRIIKQYQDLKGELILKREIGK